MQNLTKYDKIRNQGQRKHTGRRGILITYSTYKGLSHINAPINQMKKIRIDYKKSSQKRIWI